jgi:hypothetical protein
MYPENNEPAMNSDYLNQIASKPQKKSLIPKSKPVMIGVIAIGFLILVTIVGVVASVASGSVGDTEKLAARLQATQSVVESAKPNIKNSQLRGFNSELSTYLITIVSNEAPILAKHNINVNKLSKNVIASESDAKILATLEDARLNAIYDRIYASEMAHQLDITMILMQKIYKSTNDSNLKNFLSNAYQTLQPTQKQFADYNATDG